MNATGGRRDWNSLSDIQPQSSPPQIPPIVVPVPAHQKSVVPGTHVVHLVEELREVQEKALADESGAELGGGQRDHDRVGDDLLGDVAQVDRGFVPRGGVARVEVGVPGLRRAVLHQEEIDDEHDEDGRGRDEEDHLPSEMSHHPSADGRARKYPLEIMIPKMPPKMPRSRTWNHAAFTFTTDSAPKLWKYMLTA